MAGNKYSPPPRPHKPSLYVLQYANVHGAQETIQGTARHSNTTHFKSTNYKIMATRALIRVIPRQEGLAYDQAHNHVEKAFFNIYRHWDGYPAGLGVDIARVCSNIKDKNVSEFAIDFVSIMEDTDKIELLAISDVDMGQEYIYTIFPKNDTAEVFISIL